MARKTYTSQNLNDLLDQMPSASASFMRQAVSRRNLLGGVAGMSALGLLGRAGAQEASPSPEATSNVWTPPEDAAPLDQQFMRFVSDPAYAVAVDFYERVYGRPAVADVFSIALVFLSKEFEITPGAATEWSSNDDGTEWTFKLRDDLVWSDGNKVTAADYVKTFQYAADPEHAWDFSWFWDGNILNFTECLAGTTPLEELGVKQGANEYEVVFTTTAPAPYLPAKLLYSLPLSKAALETSGALYNSNPDTAVSSGPFIVSEWSKDQQLVYTRNEAYSGPWQIPLQKIIIKFGAPTTAFTLFDSGEIDFVEGPAPADLLIMQSDPEKAKQIYQGVGDFACLYFFFDVTKAPFDNLKVRQAFAHVIDRDAMKKQIWTDQANPALTYLMPGFPSANEEALKDVQAFDPDLGKSLLADAGYPDGKDFPKLVMTVRGGATPMEDATTRAYASMIEEHLGIPCEVTSLERQAFYDDMKSIPFGWVSYGMDYFDASNMLGVWKTGGRHSWSNADFDKKLDEATVFLGDSAERDKMFQAAEKILVEDCPAVWTYHPTPIQLIKPYVIGNALTADSNGIAAVHWPGFALNGSALHEIYISKDAPTDRQ